MRIQYKCLVPIYVFPEMKLGSPLIFKTELYDVLSTSSYTHILYVSVRNLYVSRIDQSILLWTDPGNISIARSHMNVEIGTEAAQFPEKEHINVILFAVCFKVRV